MKRRVWIAVVSTLLLNSFALGQTSSHFDLSGNATFSGAKLANAPSATTQVDAFGWQTSGITHLNRWLALTSQFGSGYASANSLQLIGYTGPGTITHYSMLVGPRITVPTRGRLNPFFEALVGGDRASTKLSANGISVTGREMQLAYSVGGGTQINLNRRFGVNVEAQYLGTEHSLAFTGWQPASLQISAGIVIRMFPRTPQIAEQRPMPSPTTTGSEQPSVAAVNTNSSAEAAAMPMPVASIQPPSAPSVESKPTVVESKPIFVESKPAVVATTTPEIQPVAPAAAPQPPAVASQTPMVTAKAAAPAPAIVPQPAPKPVVAVVPAPVTPSVPIATAAPVRVAVAAAPVSRVIAQAQPQPTQPLSLGEYARRLREQKQRERQQQQQQ